ncbi:MAG TPA: hypothetical protein PLP19_16595 [bacterium]|nr:hypothetical protein [bacterium]HPN45113.1 hypothetical protein [bacterium]
MRPGRLGLRFCNILEGKLSRFFRTCRLDTFRKGKASGTLGDRFRFIFLIVPVTWDVSKTGATLRVMPC